MRKHKLITVIVLLYVMGLLGPPLLQPSDRWAAPIGGLMLLATVLLFGWVFVRFVRWHRAWHFWLIAELMRPKRSSGGGQ